MVITWMANSLQIRSCVYLTSKAAIKPWITGSANKYLLMNHTHRRHCFVVLQVFQYVYTLFEMSP